MPRRTTSEERAAGWMEAADLPRLARQRLAPDRVQKFLSDLFGAVATKPTEMRLREGAAVARYLKAVALSSRPENGRLVLMALAETVGRQVLDVAPIKMATQQKTLRFLERHSGTYFNHPQLRSAIQLIRGFAGINPDSDFFPQTKLASRTTAVQGRGGQRIGNDLSERIYAAYYALRRTRVRGARGLVADALNQKLHRTRPRSPASSEWTGAEVYERVKQYEKHLRKHHQCDAARDLRLVRDALVNKWIWGSPKRAS